MKNIYLLPTGESRLSLNRSYRDFNVGTESGEPYWIYSDYKHFHSVTDSSVRPHHMYITNDEEIKEGDWCLYLGLSMTWFKLIEIDDYKLYWGSREYFNKNLCKKIILTTDQELIKDGVQAIDDEFLEWFVKNPSCDRVVVTPYLKDIINSLTNEKYPVIQHRHFDETKMICTYDYELIIPKEEPKQETLEEVAEKYATNHGMMAYVFPEKKESFIQGAKWQKEQDKNKYSEEEVVKLLIKFNQEIQEVENVREWFEEFKKK